jgi:hypothetical protein
MRFPTLLVEGIEAEEVPEGVHPLRWNHAFLHGLGDDIKGIGYTYINELTKFLWDYLTDVRD